MNVILLLKGFYSMLVPVDVLFLGDTELWKCLTWAWVSLLLSWGHVGLAWERKVMGWKVEFGSRARECESVRCSVVSTSLQPVDCSPPGSSVHGILQARILEWLAVPFSRGSSLPRDRTQVSRITGRFFTI